MLLPRAYVLSRPVSESECDGESEVRRQVRSVSAPAEGGGSVGGGARRQGRRHCVGQRISAGWWW
jgi:hypothetical protein